MPVEELTLRTASVTDVLSWLTMPKGPHLVDGGPIEDSKTALAILVTPGALYDPDSPRVGLGLVYKAPYIQMTTFTKAFFFLKSASRPEASTRITQAWIVLVQLHESSKVIPLPRIPTLFLDVQTADDVTDSNEARSPQDFRGFHLHRISYAPESDQGTPIQQVAYPCLQGVHASHWLLAPRSELAPEMEEMPELSVALAKADKNHWNIVNDPVFPKCLDSFKARYESRQAAKATKRGSGSSSHGEGSTSAQKLPSPSSPQHPTLAAEEVDEMVTEIIGQLHDLHLETVQEMGFIRAIDKALAKSIMVEFMRLRLIIVDDVYKTLKKWHADMEHGTEELIRDLDSATQTSTALPPKMRP